MGIYKRYVIRNALRNTVITLAESNFIAVRTLLWSKIESSARFPINRTAKIKNIESILNKFNA